MFVVDDLVSWLIGRLADAGYQKLAALVRGSDQARALKTAATAAVQMTVGEIGLSDREGSERVAEQINKAFRRREPVSLPPGQPTLLEALQAGIAGQLSAGDNAGQPALSLMGTPVSDVAATLTGHLIREIQIRGSHPGPLTALADQLNHDLTHLQGQRLEGMLAQVLDWLGDALAPARGAAGPVGWPLADVGDPFALEVHRPVEPDVPQAGLPALPVYVPRAHDAALTEVVTAAAAAGARRIATLVGGSSTGKTRACWQALELLRGTEPGWRLWHPIDAQATLAGLPGVGPRTVVWLNEAQRYLDTADGTGERAAAGLRELLRNPARGPVLVLATLWPEYWDQLTARTPAAADAHAQARELLEGHDIRVAAAFTDEQLLQLKEAGDPRLAQASTGSRDGQVIQYLAGAPDLLARYHNAPHAARALIDAAMDGRRLGMGPALPRAFLETAAPGYLTDTDWNLQPPDWLEQALDYTAKPCKGVLGPLTHIRPRPAPNIQASRNGGPAWQLADYLDQHGRRVRRELIPPAAFWAAAASYADPADLASLGEAAEDRGLSRTAAHMYKQASAHGDPSGGAHLVHLLHSLHPDDLRPADWAATHASLDNPRAVAALLGRLRETGASGQATALASRAAAHASLDNPYAVAELLDRLREMGAAGQVTTLASRAATQISVDDTRAVTALLNTMSKAWAAGRATLASRAAAHASLDDPSHVAGLLSALLNADATQQVATLLDRDPAAHVSLDDTRGVGELLTWLHLWRRWAETTGQFAALASRAADEASLDDPSGVGRLLYTLRMWHATRQAAALAGRAAAHISVDDPSHVARLLFILEQAHAIGELATLVDRDPAAHVRLDNPSHVAHLLRALRKTGKTGQVATLIGRDPAAHVSLDDPTGVAGLLKELRQAGAAAGQVAALLGRDPAAQASLDDPYAVANLLDALRQVGAAGQFAALASRAAAHASLDNPTAVANLLEALRRAGAAGQVMALASRAAAHASLDNPTAVAMLLEALREAGAAGQAAALAGRAAAHVSLDSQPAVARLLKELRQAGARTQAAELIKRLPAAGQFRLFCQQEGRTERFRFGREADGRPAKPWAWTDPS